jgi:RNA polymerase sigma-70 factor (ECF subfamily)
VEPDDIDALARRAKGNDSDALEELLAAVRPRTLAICRKVLPRSHDAEDACQEALLRVATKLDRWSGQGRFTSWLQVVALNSARTTYRRLLNQPVPTDEVPERADPRGTESIASLRVDLRHALVALRMSHPQYVEPLMLRAAYDLAYHEIAQHVGAPVGTVKARIHYGRRYVTPRLVAAG